MCAMKKVPFAYTGNDTFQDKLIEWIGDVLYDILPEHQYEVRDEQIFTAFQIGDAFGEKRVHLAEAGLGTGKTFAYLLSAIPYARHTRKPVIISCASPALQEQLASDSGDIAKLSKLLGLDVDARMAKDPRQYVCDVRANANLDAIDESHEEIRQWIQTTTRGERQEVPTLADHVWKKISWNESMSCEVCSSRGYCKLVRAREHYRQTQDLIIVDHETFFHDLWTREEKLANGHMPILPEYSAVIFDEGHKIMLPAAMQAGQQIIKEELMTMIESLEDIQGARDSYYEATGELEDLVDAFFNQVIQAVVTKEAEGRRSVKMNDTLWSVANRLRGAFDTLLMEIQIEQELYLEELPTSLIQAYEGLIERAMKGLAMLSRNKGAEVIAWVEEQGENFVVVPRHLNTMLNQALYSKKLPVIFSSATLSNEGDFDYFIRTLGLKSPSKSTIGSPFNMEEQVKVSFVEVEDSVASERIQELVSLLEKNGGSSLVLTRSLSEVRELRRHLKGHDLPFEVLYEDQADRGYLVRKFKADETSVLISSSFWEGIDVPGNALTLLVIWQLPFPTADPLIEAQRKEATQEGLDAVTSVDYPEMGLKLKQGCGRLIRTEEDHGEIVFMEQVVGKPWEQIVRGAVPKGAEVIVRKMEI